MPVGSSFSDQVIRKGCKLCGKTFETLSRNATHCPDCRPIVRSTRNHESYIKRKEVRA